MTTILTTRLASRLEDDLSKSGMRDPLESGHSGRVIPFAAASAPAPETDLATVLIELVERCGRQLAPGITLGLSAKLGAGAAIAASEARVLESAICEIVWNAYRYSHPGGTPVEVTIECRVNRTGEIVVDIGDDGIGLPLDFAEWRDAGHGMVMVRALLQKLGAALSVTSDDLGLRFQIVLHPSALRPRGNPARGNFVWL